MTIQDYGFYRGDGARMCVGHIHGVSFPPGFPLKFKACTLPNEDHLSCAMRKCRVVGPFGTFETEFSEQYLERMREEVAKHVGTAMGYRHVFDLTTDKCVLCDTHWKDVPVGQWDCKGATAKPDDYIAPVIATEKPELDWDKHKRFMKGLG